MSYCSHQTRVILRWTLIAASVALGSNVRAQPPPPGAAAAVQPIEQVNGNVVSMPLKGAASRKSGLLLSVDTRWANGYGYLPVEVSISSPKPTTADHLITIQLHSGWENEISVEQDFEFPLGLTKASTTVAVPKYEQMSNYFWWDVWVDGVKDVDLTLDRVDAVQVMGGSAGSVSGIKFLVAGRSQNHRSLYATNASDFEVLTLKPGAFPRRWIDYTCLDVVSLSTVELQFLSQADPAAFEALERWVRTGGQLWVSDVGDKLDQLPQVSKLLQMAGVLLPAMSNDDPKETNEKDKVKAAVEVRPAEVGWRPVQFRSGTSNGQRATFLDTRTGRERIVRDPTYIAALQRDPNFTMTSEEEGPDNATRARRWPKDSGEIFVEQRLGMGIVRAFCGANEAALFSQAAPAVNANAATNGGPGGQLPRALAMGLQFTQHWEGRHGMAPDSTNKEFANLLVPGVGLAPVTEFQVLISVFVLLIGPLNYWLLKRFKRLHLLVLTVPLLAGLMTATLFAYAIVSDGFSTTVRARSFTTLDQRTGEAACWARLSYYAGLAPGKGLSMPADVVVYPILPSWSTEANRLAKRDAVWREDGVQLTRGWLSSRTPTQYLTLRARKSPCRLDVISGGGNVRVSNRLGTQIESVLLIDEAGKFFGGEKLASDASAPLEAISREEAVKRIGNLVRDNQPESPAALAGSDRDFAGMRARSGRRMYRRYSQQDSTAQLTENLAAIAISDLAGLNGRPALDLPPRSYVAVTTSGPEVVIGIPNAKEEASFHVIVGRW